MEVACFNTLELLALRNWISEVFHLGKSFEKQMDKKTLKKLSAVLCQIDIEILVRVLDEKISGEFVDDNFETTLEELSAGKLDNIEK